MRLLVKIPSRSRPDRLQRVLDECARLWSGADRSTRILISYDHDDPTMERFDPPAVSGLPIVSLPGTRTTKVGAINRDIDGYPWKWNVLLLLADDMFPVAEAFDLVITSHMALNFPDTNGCLWFSDGRQDKHCTVPVMGRKYWEEHGRVIYDTRFDSYYCDVLQTIVATREEKMVKVPGLMFRHDHACFRANKPDPLLAHNQAFKLKDRHTFKQLEQQGFPL